MHPYSVGVRGVRQVSTALAAACAPTTTANKLPECCLVERMAGGALLSLLHCACAGARAARAPGSRLARARAQLDSGSFTQTAEGSSALTSGRGKPVRVHAHRKLVKELTDLLLTQELAAHEGAPWVAQPTPSACMQVLQRRMPLL